MKICFYDSNSLRLGGGAENWIVEVSSRLVKRHHVCIAGLMYTSRETLDSERIPRSACGFEYTEFPFVKFPRGVPLPNPRYVGKLLDLFNSCDVTYVVTPRPPTELLLSFIKSNIGCTLIAGFHGSLRADVLLQQTYMPLLKRTLSTFKGFHAVDLGTCHWLKDLGFKHVFHIPNGVNPKIFSLHKQISRSIFTVLCAGRLSSDKGADTLERVIRRVGEQSDSSKIKFLIAGSGPLEDKIRELAREHGNVEYLGLVPHARMPALYARAHLFFLPSKSDVLPLALLEAQSCGLPAICSKIHGIVDVISDRSKGRLIDKDDIKGFILAIYEYYHLWQQSPEAYRALSKEIRDHTVKNYSWDMTLGKLETMFRQCVDNELIA